MTAMNAGYIESNKPFTDEAKAFIIEEFGSQHRYKYTIKEKEIEFFEYYCRDFDESVKFIINHLAPLGYVLNGLVEYYCDWEGRYDIVDNKVTVLSREEAIICDADDRTLINELEERGYTVIKKGN